MPREFRVEKLSDEFGQYTLVLKCSSCGHARMAEPHTLARLFATWKWQRTKSGRRVRHVMNRDNPARPPTHPALSGEAWDSDYGTDKQPTRDESERPAKSKFSRPVNADSQPLIFTSGEED